MAVACERAQQPALEGVEESMDAVARRKQYKLAII